MMRGWDTARMMSSTRRGALAVIATAVMFGAWGIAAVWSRYEWSDVPRWGPDLVVGFGWLVYALMVITRDATPRVGQLMLFFSGTWFIGNFAALESGELAGLAAQATYLHRGVLVHLLLTFPGGRLDGRLVKVLVVAGYGVSWLPMLARSASVTIALACLVTGAAGWRVRKSFGQARVPRVTAFAAALLMTTSLVVLAAIRLSAVASVDDGVLLAYQVVLLVIGAILTTAALRIGAFGGDVTDLVVDLADGPPFAMAAALGEAVGDPSVRIGYWSPERELFLDSAGSVFAVDALPGRIVSVVRSREGPLMALDHDAAITLSAGVSSSLEQAASLMVANARLHAELRERARELEAARRRLVDTEIFERRRLEEQLRSGAGRRLETLNQILLAAGRVSGPNVATELEAALKQLDRSVADVSRLSRGLYPSTLTVGGLPAALGQLSDQVPVRIQMDLAGEVPEHLRELVYFVCAEALANVVKHARARSARISVFCREGLMHVEVTDDGVGPPSPERVAGSGLRGLADRVGAYGGAFRVAPAPSGGTRVAVEVPLDGRSAPPLAAPVVIRPSPTGGP
jgi:signal transduction histidine kinase